MSSCSTAQQGVCPPVYEYNIMDKTTQKRLTLGDRPGTTRKTREPGYWDDALVKAAIAVYPTLISLNSLEKKPLSNEIISKMAINYAQDLITELKRKSTFDRIHGYGK